MSPFRQPRQYLTPTAWELRKCEAFRDGAKLLGANGTFQKNSVLK